ncbi:MAG TPA: Spy/CpxP family protein refolding chaperone [Terracidiphilus sp.]|nr:Spy/CpxP family protein refolding chaperone [Terracidiphilus sp.]
MRVLTAVRLGVVIAGSFAAILASAQAPAPGGPGGPGFGGPGFGGHRPPMERAMRGDHGRWWNNPKIVEKLSLTDDQRKAMDAIYQQHREQLIDLRAAVEKAEVGMEPMVSADQPNESAVLAQIDKVAQARAELEKANARFLFELRSKLTPDQWKQVQEYRQNRQELRRQWRDRRGPGSSDQAAPPPAPGAPGPQGMLNDGPADEIPILSVNP